MCESHIKKKEDVAHKLGNNLVIDAAGQYMGEHSKQYLNGGTYCILIKDLIDDGKLVSPVKDVVSGESLEEKTVKVVISMSGKTTYEIVDSNDCENSIDDIPFTPGKITAIFGIGAKTKEVGYAETICEGEECEITFPTITSENDCLFGGWSIVKEEKKSDIIPGTKLTINKNTAYYGNSIDGKPVITQIKEGKYKIDYPSGCAAPYSCTYQVGNGTKIPVEPNQEDNTKPASTIIKVGINTTITAEAKDTCDNTAKATYNVSRTNLYVSSLGSDTDGYGTVEEPYATINKAYSSASATSPSTIYVMNNITNLASTNMNGNKTITLTSSNTSGVAGSTINTVTRGNTNNIINQTTGSLTITNITLNGNNVSSSNAMVIVKSATINSGTTLTNAVNTGNNTGNGGALYVNAGTLTINAGTFTNNKANHGGVIFNNGGTVTISNGTFSNNEATSNGGVVRNYNTNTKMTINNGTFTSNKAEYGGTIYNDKNSSLTIKAGTYTKNSAGGTSGTKGSGGVLFNYGTTSITGGTFGGSTANKNTARQHGGAIKNWGTLNITGGTISYNESNEEGGGISTEGDSNNAGTLTINGDNVLIAYNKAVTTSGGGIYGGPDATIYLKKGKVQYNTAKRVGGGISITGKKLNMSGGYVQHNTSDKSGGGVYIKSGSAMSFSGGVIKKNTSNEKSSDDDTYKGGGGIAANGTLTMTDGLIAGNEAPKGDGGGIRIGADGKLKLSGGIIRRNKAKNSGGIDNVYGDKGHYSGPGKAHVCKNNEPTNGYDNTKATNDNCKKTD